MYKMYPDAGIYTTGCKIVSNSGTQRVKFIKHNEEVFKIEDYFKEFVKLGGPINNSSTSVVKKDSLFTVGLFPENLKNFEDWNVWFKVALVEDVVYSKKILSIIYLNAVNREHHKDSDTNILKAYDKVISDIEKFIQVNKLNRKSIDLLFQTKAQSFINKAIKTKNFEFLNNFKFAIIHNYTNSYQRIIYFTNINRLVYFVYKILSTLGVKR